MENGVDVVVPPLMRFSDCIVNGNIDLQRLLRFQKRSHDELHGLLFSNSLLVQRHDEEDHNTEVKCSRNERRSKKPRKEKQVVMFTDPQTGVRLRLYPTMSLWYVSLSVLAHIALSCFLTRFFLMPCPT